MWPSGSTTETFLFPIRFGVTWSGALTPRESQILPHPLNVIRVEAQMVQLAFTFVRLVHQFQVLMVVDFHECHLHRAVGLRTA